MSKGKQPVVSRHRPSSVNDVTPSPILLKEPVKRSKWRPENGPSLLELVRRKREEEGEPSVMTEPRHRPSSISDAPMSPVVLKEPNNRASRWNPENGPSLVDQIKSQRDRSKSLSPERDSPVAGRRSSPMKKTVDRDNNARGSPARRAPSPKVAKRDKPQSNGFANTQKSSPEVELAIEGPAGKQISLPAKIPQGHRRPAYPERRNRYLKQPSEMKLSSERPELDNFSPPGHKSKMSPYSRALDPIRSDSHVTGDLDSNRSSVLSFLSRDDESPVLVDHFEEADFQLPPTEDWQDGKTLAECNRNMLLFEIDCDVTFIAGESEEPVRAHSYVLMSRSALLGSKIKSIERPEKIIAVPDVSVEAMRNMLTYIYTNELELTIKSALELILPSHKYGLKTLKNDCFHYLLGEMSSDNVNLTLEKAHQFNERDFYDRCLFFIHINAKDVLKTPNFRGLCKSCVDDIVKSDDLNADEWSVFNGLVMWSNGECSRRKIQPTDLNRREVLGSLLFRTRFATMNVKDFARMAQREVLTQEEKIELYQHFHGQATTLPERFTKQPRRVYRINEQALRNDGTPTPRNSSRPLFPGDPFMKIEAPEFEAPVLRALRFKGVGWSWQMKGPDAISFMCTASIVLRGVQIFGPYQGNHSYEVELSVYSNKDTIRNETISAFTKSSKVYDVLLTDPVLVPRDRKLTIVTSMKGEPTLRGTDGETAVTSEGVEFFFTNSSLSINGTDVTMGQIPAILFSKPKR